jgi:hypothetical protein
MSQISDHRETFKEMLLKYKDIYSIVIDVFVSTISNQEWSEDDIIYIISVGLGISSEIDDEINRHIDIQKDYKV